MSRKHFLFSMAGLWGLLTIGEWLRMRPELRARKPLTFLWDSLILSLTDMIGAVIIGTVGWVLVWVVRAYEGQRLQPCPTRTTLTVIAVSAALLFTSRWIPLHVLAQHIAQTLIVLCIAAFAYYAGSRHWLGKW